MVVVFAAEGGKLIKLLVNLTSGRRECHYRVAHAIIVRTVDATVEPGMRWGEEERRRLLEAPPEFKLVLFCARVQFKALYATLTLETERK